MPVANYPFIVYGPYSVSKPFLPIIITNPDNGFTFQTWGLIDTGADTSAIPEFIGKPLGHITKAGKKAVEWGVGGSTTVYYHKAQIDILGIDSQGTVLGDVLTTIKRKIAIVPELRVTLLGEDDLLKHHILTINYPKQIFSLSKPTS